ncbi:MAG: peptide ABC transporter permease [Gammaproteobacteria bacterium RIFOXYA12_FULL_61_12]|nr:MAG: peptide ABC transporter permease [Gammaproteobacteria bacterium RIFOXYA12_FULL_61_12]OGT88540.1 MAG: peptide ABC transporter permease [Gammaproteobacteria bacterium RIFOXYD12_FULL_61_37]
MPELVILWTDALIFLLVAGILLFAGYARRREPLCAPWRKVVRSRVGVASLIVLFAYVAVGLLDSVHFRAQDAKGVETGEVLSLFDRIASPLRTRQEKTYSAPLALHLYAKENIETPDGNTVRDYPRLEHAGSHLATGSAAILDQARLLLVGAFEGLLLWAGVVALLAGLLAWREGSGFLQQMEVLFTGDEEDIPWTTVLVMLGMILVLGAASWQLAQHYHLLGTDKVGEDVFYQALKSIRTGLVIGTLTTLVMLPAALLLGMMAGYFGGWIDDLIQYLYTTLNSIPGVLLIAAAVLMLNLHMDNHAEQFGSVQERADMRLLFLCLILGVTSWTGLCRLLRGEALKLRELDYVQAALSMGVGHFTILARHILPNVGYIVLITLVLDFSGLVLAEAVLSYVNIGVDPTTYSWGNMINSARLEMAREPVVWWSLLASMMFMFILVLAANLFADAVRDAFDPRLRNER